MAWVCLPHSPVSIGEDSSGSHQLHRMDAPQTCSFHSNNECLAIPVAPLSPLSPLSRLHPHRHPCAPTAVFMSPLPSPHPHHPSHDSSTLSPPYVLTTSYPYQHSVPPILTVASPTLGPAAVVASPPINQAERR
ncbi:hypothetical protein BOTBODRAFT_171139 [Botryobasidium botryosum FD-172 SS1]|uniref:Uncharacterized protein n=1 Tax=Botryobasidium botryosum (strain FD-172 SS1) TaxID=930990 RepID=A0A067N4Y3_BOTB1|nr:hypothetical protein BOTBODRAFT_171139 [Botryobasidium botryosum FD-172 SS1]